MWSRRRAHTADPADWRGDDARGDGEPHLPADYWPTVARVGEIAAAARTRRVPLTLTGITATVGTGAWGAVSMVDVLGGPQAGSAATVGVCAAAWATVPVGRALLRDRISAAGERTDGDPDRWVRRWWVGSACAACWVNAVTIAGPDMTGTGAIAASAALTVGSWLVGSRWFAAHEVPDPGQDEVDVDGQPTTPVPAVAVRVPEIDPAEADAHRIERDWVRYVANGENAIAIGSELKQRERLAYGWRWVVQLDRGGSTTSKQLATNEKADGVALKLVRRSSHVMLDRLLDGNDRADLATLTVITHDMLADGVPYTGPNYDRGVIRIGRYADGSGEATWTAYDHTGVQFGLITGDPRSGKSAFLAKLAGDFKSSGEWNVLFGDGDPRGMSSPVLAEIADDLARGSAEILQQLEGLEAVQQYVRGDLMGTLTIGPDGKPALMTRPDQTPADKWLPCPEYPGLAWFLDEFWAPSEALRSVDFAKRVAKVVRGLAKYGLSVIVSTQSKLGADFGGDSDLRAWLAKNEISFRTENHAGMGAVGDGSTDPSTLPKDGGYAFLGHGERHAMIRTEFTKDPVTGGSNMHRWVPQIQAAGVDMDELTAAVYRRFRPVVVLDRAADHATRTGRLADLRAALDAGAPLPGSPEALAADQSKTTGEGPGEKPAQTGGGVVPSLASVVVPIRRKTEPEPAPDESDLPNRPSQMLDLLRSRPGGWRTADVAEALGWTVSAVSTHGRLLLDRKLVHRPSGVQGVYAAGPPQHQLKDRGVVI